MVFTPLKQNILITGKNSRFCKYLKNDLVKYNTIFTSKEIFDVCNYNKMKNFVKNKKIKYLIHIAGLSRPMNIHEKKIDLSINLNIIGTANIVKLCNEFNIKLIYFSTNYVYPGKIGNYKETDCLLPTSSYAWSKLGGEAAVQLYKNSLILRVSMTEKPFVHKAAFKNVKSNFMYQDEVAKLLFKILDKRGILNIGGKRQTIYNFARMENKKIKKLYLKKSSKNLLPFDSSMNISKLKKILMKSKT